MGPKKNKVLCDSDGQSNQCCLSSATVFAAIILYIVLGGIAFYFLEQSQHTVPSSKLHQNEDLDILRNSTVQRLWTLTVELNVFYESNWTQVAEVELQKFQDDILKYLLVSDYYDQKYSYNRGCDFTNFPAAILYSLTLITTIGYGTVSPRSIPGRILTVIYASIGIPLTLCYLATLGDFFARIIKKMYIKLGMGKTRKLPLLVPLVLFFMYLCGGAMLFQFLEGWPFVDAVFFCFASLSTIGFGGMLDPHSKSISLIASSIYILCGMALISTVFNLVQEQVLSRNEEEYHPPVS